jgi:hypothetical protein
MTSTTSNSTTKPRLYTKKEDALIRRLYPTTCTADVAEMLHRSTESVRARAKTIGVRKQGRRPNRMKPARRPPTRERGCLRCVNYPCFEGIDNLETDFAKAGCHGYKQREPQPLNP